jgi:hypothetical protein
MEEVWSREEKGDLDVLFPETWRGQGVGRELQV